MHICPVCLSAFIAFLASLPLVGKWIHHMWHRFRKEKSCSESAQEESCSLDDHETCESHSAELYDPLDPG